MTKLGVNIDHVATLRQARKEFDPDPVKAAAIAERCGADSIVCHLREDRRHINESDVLRLKRSVRTKLNLEMSVDPSIVAFALKVRPDYAMLVPERRTEVTTEGGLDVIKHRRRIKSAVARLKKKGITVSIFIDPVKEQIDAAHALGAKIIELHTGHYANAKNAAARQKELNKIKACAAYARRLGLMVHAGHGLKYHNVGPLARIKDIDELNIGHAIISQAIFTGLADAVRKMKRLVR